MSRRPQENVSPVTAPMRHGSSLCSSRQCRTPVTPAMRIWPNESARRRVWCTVRFSTANARIATIPIQPIRPSCLKNGVQLSVSAVILICPSNSNIPIHRTAKGNALPAMIPISRPIIICWSRRLGNSARVATLLSPCSRNIPTFPWT